MTGQHTAGNSASVAETSAGVRVPGRASAGFGIAPRCGAGSFRRLEAGGAGRMDASVERRAEPLTIATEAVRGSDVPLRLMLCETIDGLYAPIGLRVPP